MKNHQGKGEVGINKEDSLVKKITGTFKKKNLKVLLNIFQTSRKEEPSTNWEEKVLERKLKTLEAKRLWEENKKKTYSQSIQNKFTIQETSSVEEIKAPEEEPVIEAMGNSTEETSSVEEIKAPEEEPVIEAMGNSTEETSSVEEIKAPEEEPVIEAMGNSTEETSLVEEIKAPEEERTTELDAITARESKKAVKSSLKSTSALSPSVETLIISGGQIIDKIFKKNNEID